MDQVLHPPGSSALYSLDEPHAARPRTKWLGALAILAYAAVIGYIATHGSTYLPPVVWVPVAHAIVVAVACGFTAVIILGQATTSGRRGYLVLGGTYLYVALLLVGFPLVFPGAIVAEGSLIGGPQSSISIFYAWHIVALLGLITAINVLWLDQRTHRRPGLSVSVAQVVVVVACLAITTIVLAAAQPISFLGDAGELLPVGTAMDVAILGLAIAAVVSAALAARRGAQIQCWLLAVAILLLGEAVLNLVALGRWSVAWYFNRLFGMIALATLFGVLLVLVSRVGRATSTLAAADPLTGCESRASFGKSLDREIASSQTNGTTRALLWIDLDGFKSINDQLGHVVGDDVLRTAVQRIQQQVRTGDHVGRLGGDEFGVLLCDQVCEDTLDAVAERILMHLREPMAIGTNSILLSGSIGIASTGDRDTPMGTQLLHHADLAMYAAKRNGGDRSQRFDSDLDHDALDRAQLRLALSRAIREGAFELDYQPIVDLRDGRVIGAEALARWRRGHDRLSASEFISYATQTGQITPIGRQLMEKVEAELPFLLSRLQPEGFASVNLSVRELTDSEILERLQHGPIATLADRVVLEITDSTELSDAEPHLSELRSLGYRVALDDFGAGFSNLNRLEQLHPQLIKVDQSLVARAGCGRKGGEAFLAAAVSVAECLDCDLVAEGVQSATEEAAVRRLGIAMGQGYRFGRPVPLDRWPD